MDLVVGAVCGDNDGGMNIIQLFQLVKSYQFVYCEFRLFRLK